MEEQINKLKTKNKIYKTQNVELIVENLNYYNFF